MSWIFSSSCSGPSWDTISSSPSTTSLFSQAQEWIAYIVFSQCPQHAISSIINLAFVVTSLFLGTGFSVPRAEPTFSAPSSSARAGWRFSSTFAAASALAITSSTIAIFQLTEGFYHATWSGNLIRETFFSSIEASAWITSIVFLLKEKRRKISKHPLSLRSWWFAYFLLSVLQFMSSIFRLSSASGLSYSILLRVYDISSLAKFPFSLFLLIILMNGDTGLHAAPCDYAKLSQPLLSQGVDSLSTFAKANVISKSTFAWLTPLLVAGSKQTLEVIDVPSLAPQDSAESISNSFQSKWPHKPGYPHPVRVTLLKCFWPQLLLTALLQLIRTLVLYVGPLLINSFTSYANGDRVSQYDGYVLVVLLLAAKLVEVFSYHHYNFQCNKLGNNARTAIVTMLYMKGLRLSSASRQDHGVGQITNYMVVDAQQISDACLQLHLCWSMPLQVIVAMVLLYRAVGVAALTGLAVMIVIAVITLINTHRRNFYTANLMKMRDTRMKAITEALAYMKIIKLQAWERKFQQRVEQYRQAEFHWLTKFVIVAAENMFTLWNTLPLVSVFTYVTATLLDAGLTTSRVFTAASIFRIVQEPVRNFPQAVNAISQLWVSLERLDAYMLSSELDQEAVSKSLQVTQYPVVVERGYFAWSDMQDMPILSDINLCFSRGSLVTIVGSVGSGKSSLLLALLGEMVKVSGIAKTTGSVAYVPQTAWIQNATIKDNILFGAPLDHARYQEVLYACGLELDLASMDYGDQTEIGEKGINLSGGQKQRIQLARAVYQNCDVYLLDDVFSAVDAHTGSHLFKECIRGLLKGKTVVMVTHQVEFLIGANLVVVMRDGRISQMGKYAEILSTGSDFAALVAAHNQAMNQVDGQKNSTVNDGVHKLDRESSQKLSMQRNLSKQRQTSSDLLERLPTSDSLPDSKLAEGSSKLIEEEQRETGHVSWLVYWLYLTKAYGWLTVAVLVVNQSTWQAFLLASDYWLAGEIPKDASGTINKKRFILVYVLLNAGAWIGILVRVTVVAAFGLKTAQIFFLDMLRGIFHAPMSFFDTTPSGRILSRFSADQTNLDFLLHFFIGGCISGYFSLFGVIIVVSISTWPIVLMVIPLAWLYYLYQKFYITSSREITRLDSITKAPLIYHFSETVAGIEVVRCFRKGATFSQQNLDLVNTNMKMDFHNIAANEWLGLRLECLGTAILCTTAFLLVVLPGDFIKTEAIGLTLSYALSLNSGLYFTIWLTCTIENKMVSVERIRQFTNIPTEAVLSIPDCFPQTSWPTTGKIVSTRLKLRYRPSTPLVLRGVTFTIAGGQKVGVVGRTGSGKSTLVLALFRLVEPCGGEVLIDGVDISTIGLHDLRSKLGIIPQDPVLFEGTVRINLDPLGIYTDEEIWRGLEKCQLAQVISEKPGKLEASVSEAGSNWSVGQRQLMCFGRALLKHSKLLFLDEATASVDAQTDAVIQKVIRSEFADCTVVSIAHRIPTVMDSDKVLVMDEGRVKEFESPTNLLLNSSSLFSALVQEYSTRATHPT